jgi:hypothetical protein
MFEQCFAQTRDRQMFGNQQAVQYDRKFCIACFGD